MKAKITKLILMCWCLFIGVGALFGGIYMLIDPTGKAMGMDAMLPYFQVLPFSEYVFRDFIFSGISLIIVNGITNITAVILMFLKKKVGIILGAIFGFTLMLWICIQFYMFPANFMDIAFFIFGALQFITGFAAWVFYCQEHFAINKDSFKNISQNSDTVVVYFSRIGYTERIAFEKANELNAEILKIESSEKTDGILGFWWCGRYGMHGWKMPIKEIEIDLSKYKRIILCSPVWVFDLCGTMKDFIEKNKNELNECELIINHFNAMKYGYIFDKTENEYSIHFSNKTTICTKIGHEIYQKQI